jgi:serine/threonine protein kinase
LSPEQAVGGEIKPASDLYSTSIVLYEMLTGRPPFLDEQPLAMLTAHVSRDVPPFSEVAPDLQVPPGLEDVIQAGLQKISGERTRSALEYMQRLDEVARAAGFDFGGVARASGQISIPTPVRGVATTPHPYSTPTPMPFASEIGTAPTMSTLPTAARRVSLHDIREPLPQKYKLIALLLVLGAALAAVYFLTRASDNKQRTQIISVPTADTATRLKAALHDLETGKTCADRKAAIPTLVEIGGDEAIKALRRARYRGRGGVLGIGESNANACLKSEAELGIQRLQGD